MLLKNIDKITYSSEEDENTYNIMSDMRYISNSCTLITESLQKGCDVIQLANGDIIVSELKTVTLQYSWDEKKGKLVRSQMGNKVKKNYPNKSKKVSSVNQESENLKDKFLVKETT